MATLSGCTIVRNAVKLNYPLRASIQTYLSICEEVVLAYDPTSEDETERLVFDLSKQYPKIRAIASTWDLANHDAGTEITIQSNVAIENCSCDWILYIQADEAIHEGDHQAIRNTLADTDLSGSLFERRSFLYTLDREMPEYFARNLLRLFRNGEGYAVGDAMSCALVQGVSGRISDAGWRMFNYSRIGDKEEILMRSRQRDSFYHSSEKAIEENQKRELTQRVKHFGLCSHPAPIREYYQQKPVITGRETSSPSLVTLVILMGKGELENIVPFLWQFRGWPGDIVVIDDMTTDTSAAIMHSTAAQILGAEENWIKIVRHSLSGNFSAARNLAHSLACADWVLHADLDERWDPKLIHILPQLLGQLDHDGKIICGFPRANFINGVLINDVPDSLWTNEGLLHAAQRQSWPPKNHDLQYRLMRKTHSWQGSLHEHPAGAFAVSEHVGALFDIWILHHKSLDRQQRQDSFYRSLGQTHGMPHETSTTPQAQNLREAVLSDAIERLPAGKLTIVETGTLRDPSLKARQTDGWSTYFLAQLLEHREVAQSKLFSIDINPDYIAISKQTVPQGLHRWVTWICADSRAALATLDLDSIDLLYLDSSDDPRVILDEFTTALLKLGKHSLVVVDDTGAYHAGPEGKGTLLLPEAKRQGWRIEHRLHGQSRMTILSQS